MTCGKLGGGIELHFLASGMRIRPIEGRILEKDRRTFNAQFKITEEAVTFVRANQEAAEPVHIVVGGEPAHRMILPEGGISIQHDLNEDTVGVLDLVDAINVFDRSVVSDSWQEVDVEVILDDLMDARDDPSGAIHDINYVGGVPERGNAGPRPQRTPALPAKEFDEVNGLDAFWEIMDMLGLSARVDVTGTLLVATESFETETITISSADVSELVNYTVVEQNSRVSHVVVRGTYKTADGLGSAIAKETEAPKITGYGIARIPGVTGRRVTGGAGKEISSLGELENIATRRLIRESMDDINGSIEFDGLQSSQQMSLAKATRGSLIEVDESISEACPGSPNQITGGKYALQSIDHRFNAREGWRVICQVGKIPESIDTRSWRYSPTSGISYKEDGVFETNKPDSAPRGGGTVQTE